MKNQLKLNESCNKNEVSSEYIPFMFNNEIEILSSIISPSLTITSSFLLGTISPSLASISSLSLLPIEVNAVNKDLCNKRSIILSEHNYNLLSNNNSEKQGEAQYKTYVFDHFGAKYDKLICCLYFKGDSMERRFCEKFGNRINSNAYLSLICC